MNPSVIPNGLFVNTQTPLDRKVWVLTLDELKDLGEGNIKAYNYYKGLLVFCVENRKTYIWDNVEDEYNISRVKLLEDDFIYPEGWPDINGIHYAENYYNFFEYNPSDLQGKSFKRIIVDGQAFATQLFDTENEGKFHLFIVNHPSVYNPNPDNLKWQIEDEIFEHNSYIYDYIADELFEDNDSRIDALSYGNDGEIHYWKGVEGGKPTYPNVPENHILKAFFLLSNDGVLVINNNEVLEEDVFADVSVGSITAGDTVPEGTTLTGFVKLLLNKIYHPTFTPYSISGNAGNAVEVGTNTKSITVNFTRGNIVGDLDSGVWNPALVQGNVLGAATKYWINGEDNGTNPTKSVSVLTTLGTNTVDIAVDYAEGDQPKDSKGNNYLSPEPPGTLNGVVTWQGFYYRTAIAGNSKPTAIDIRNNYTARRNNAGVINLNSGTTNVRFDVFVPQGSSITKVLDTGNFNLNITDEFKLQGSDFSGLDANGDEVLYKHYVRIIDNPYTVNSVLEITVT